MLDFWICRNWLLGVLDINKSEGVYIETECWEITIYFLGLDNFGLSGLVAVSGDCEQNSNNCNFIVKRPIPGEG